MTINPNLTGANSGQINIPADTHIQEAGTTPTDVTDQIAKAQKQDTSNRPASDLSVPKLNKHPKPGNGDSNVGEEVLKDTGHLNKAFAAIKQGPISFSDFLKSMSDAKLDMQKENAKSEMQEAENSLAILSSLVKNMLGDKKAKSNVGTLLETRSQLQFLKENKMQDTKWGPRINLADNPEVMLALVKNGIDVPRIGGGPFDGTAVGRAQTGDAPYDDPEIAAMALSQEGGWEELSAGEIDGVIAQLDQKLTGECLKTGGILCDNLIQLLQNAGSGSIEYFDRTTLDKAYLLMDLQLYREEHGDTKLEDLPKRLSENSWIKEAYQNVNNGTLDDAISVLTNQIKGNLPPFYEKVEIDLFIFKFTIEVEKPIGNTPLIDVQKLAATNTERLLKPLYPLLALLIFGDEDDASFQNLFPSQAQIAAQNLAIAAMMLSIFSESMDSGSHNLLDKDKKVDGNAAKKFAQESMKGFMENQTAEQMVSMMFGDSIPEPENSLVADALSGFLLTSKIKAALGEDATPENVQAALDAVGEEFGFEDMVGLTSGVVVIENMPVLEGFLKLFPELLAAKSQAQDQVDNTMSNLSEMLNPPTENTYNHFSA